MRVTPLRSVLSCRKGPTECSKTRNDVDEIVTHKHVVKSLKNEIKWKKMVLFFFGDPTDLDPTDLGYATRLVLHIEVYRYIIIVVNKEYQWRYVCTVKKLVQYRIHIWIGNDWK